MPRPLKEIDYAREARNVLTLISRLQADSGLNKQKKAEVIALCTSLSSALITLQARE